MNYASFLNSVSLARKPSLIREMTRRMRPDIIPLSGGLPNPECFPFVKATIEASDGTKIDIEGAEMRNALQYQATNGVPDFIDRLKSLHKTVHNPPKWSDYDLVVTPGSQDGLCKSFEMLLNDGDAVIVEDFVYSGTLAILGPFNPDYLCVYNDGKGMVPESLRLTLENWKPSRPGQSRPRVMYINPAGSNPCGTNLSGDRKREIYNICCHHDIIILEDDPYYFLQFEQTEPSFASMDTEGRVIRFDSFSKVLSSGLRLGYATGPKEFIDRIVLHMQVSVVHTSSLSQVLANELLKQWGHEGFFRHIEKVREFYIKRRDFMNSVAKKHLTGLCEWHVPAGGMFLWLRVPAVSNTWDLAMERAMAKKVMLMPGRAFSTNPDQPCSYLRAAFSLASEKDMEEGLSRLAEVIKEELSGHK